MPETKAKQKKGIDHPVGSLNTRTYPSESPALLSLRLIAAPNPKDDLSDSELRAMCVDPRHSPELIQHLIEFMKGL